MVVDDEPDVSFATTKMLEQIGCDVDSYNDPVLAASNFRAGLYSLVLLDIRMPKMDGFELYQKIRKKDKKVKICFMTAYEIYHDQFGQLPKSDINQFIKKPLDLQQLREMVEKL